MRWFRASARDLPWRTTPRDPYRSLVSEFMLQQTQVATVIGYYGRFLGAYPDVAALARAPIRGRLTLSGYEGSELLVARLLIESGADVRYVGTACPRTRWSDADREWLEAKGVQVQYRASLEQALAAANDLGSKSDAYTAAVEQLQRQKDQYEAALALGSAMPSAPFE